MSNFAPGNTSSPSDFRPEMFLLPGGSEWTVSDFDTASRPKTLKPSIILLPVCGAQSPGSLVDSRQRTTELESRYSSLRFLDVFDFQTILSNKNFFLPHLLAAVDSISGYGSDTDKIIVAVCGKGLVTREGFEGVVAFVISLKGDVHFKGVHVLAPSRTWSQNCFFLTQKE